MKVKIDPSWAKHLESEFEKPYFTDLTTFVKKEYKEEIVYPAPKNIFRAFDLCPFEKVKVVILGQDPYHETGQANGLAFAVDEKTRVPPSLQNIFKEIGSDLGKSLVHTSGDLTRWAEQGVLLLNATLTVRAHTAGSHQEKGWELFTDAVIRASRRSARTSSSCCGVIMRKQKARTSTATSISFLKRRIHHPSPPPPASSAVSTSAKRTDTSSRTTKSLLTGFNYFLPVGFEVQNF